MTKNPYESGFLLKGKFLFNSYSLKCRVEHCFENSHLGLLQNKNA